MFYKDTAGFFFTEYASVMSTQSKKQHQGTPLALCVAVPDHKSSPS